MHCAFYLFICQTILSMIGFYLSAHFSRKTCWKCCSHRAMFTVPANPPWCIAMVAVAVVRCQGSNGFGHPQITCSTSCKMQFSRCRPKTPHFIVFLLVPLCCQFSDVLASLGACSTRVLKFAFGIGHQLLVLSATASSMLTKTQAHMVFNVIGFVVAELVLPFPVVDFQRSSQL